MLCAGAVRGPALWMGAIRGFYFLFSLLQCNALEWNKENFYILWDIFVHCSSGSNDQYIEQCISNACQHCPLFIDVWFCQCHITDHDIIYTVSMSDNRHWSEYKQLQSRNLSKTRITHCWELDLKFSMMRNLMAVMSVDFLSSYSN